MLSWGQRCAAGGRYRVPAKSLLESDPVGICGIDAGNLGAGAKHRHAEFALEWAQKYRSSG